MNNTMFADIYDVWEYTIKSFICKLKKIPTHTFQSMGDKTSAILVPCDLTMDYELSTVISNAKPSIDNLNDNVKYIYGQLLSLSDFVYKKILQEGIAECEYVIHTKPELKAKHMEYLASFKSLLPTHLTVDTEMSNLFLRDVNDETKSAMWKDNGMRLGINIRKVPLKDEPEPNSPEFVDPTVAEHQEKIAEIEREMLTYNSPEELSEDEQPEENPEDFDDSKHDLKLFKQFH